MTARKQLQFWMPDSGGKKPDLSWIGEQFFHVKTRKLYTVKGFVWDSTIDAWKVHYHHGNESVTFVRALGEFGDETRYIPVAGKVNGDDE